ncbi:hypothetical protein HBI26_238350 [Parastagonospora nodorum]|nr:hypothetical protein HBI26_238350 [Parastagonospora nodorum]
MGLKMADCCKLFGKDYPEDLDDFIDFFCTQWSQRKNTIKAALASGKPSDWLLMCRQAESPDFIEKEGHPLQQQCRELLAKDPMKYKKCIHTIRNVARARMREEKKKNHTVPPHQQHTVSPNRTGSLHRTMSPNHTVLSSQDYVLQEDLHVTSPLETWVIVASDKGVLVFPLQRNDVQSNAEATFLSFQERICNRLLIAWDHYTLIDHAGNRIESCQSWSRAIANTPTQRICFHLDSNNTSAVFTAPETSFEAYRHCPNPSTRASDTLRKRSRSSSVDAPDPRQAYAKRPKISSDPFDTSSRIPSSSNVGWAPSVATDERVPHPWPSGTSTQTPTNSATLPLPNLSTYHLPYHFSPGSAQGVATYPRAESVHNSHTWPQIRHPVSSPSHSNSWQNPIPVDSYH